MRISWAPQAERDLDAIWHYIAADNPDAADRIAAMVHSTVLALGEHPKLGRAGRARQTRQFLVSGTPYLVVYRVARDLLEVAHILHGSRDWPPKRKRA